MRLKLVQKVVAHDRCKLTGTVDSETDDRRLDVWFEYSDEFSDFIYESADAFIPALLIASMYRAEDLKIEAPVSRRLYRNLGTLQDIYCQFHPDKLVKVCVTAEQFEGSEGSCEKHVGAFFSLGVDSFYTLHKDTRGMLTACPPISHLIYLTGLEQPLKTYQKRQEDDVKARISVVAHKTKKSCIFGSTNIQDELLNFGWGPYCYGAGLASVALSLSNGLGYALINSTHPYKYVIPWGSSPMFDHLWSTERTTIIHSGAELERAGKIFYHLSDDPLALKYLRTCVRNEGGEGNCGCCYKCTRTMTSFYIAGKLNKAQTFPSYLDWQGMKSNFKTRNDLGYAIENLKLAKEHSKDKRLIRILQRQVDIARAEDFFGGRSFFEFLRFALAWYFLIVPKKLLLQVRHAALTRLKQKSKFCSRFIHFIKGRLEKRRRKKYDGGPVFRV